MSVEKTETRLMNKALHYLERYSASERRLREVLSRFATRKLLDTEPALVASAMTRVVEKCQRLGYVDDFTFAASQARSQRRLGKSAMAIRHRLRQHSLDDAAIAKALHNADTDQNAELAAAIHFVRRRRLTFFPRVPDEKTPTGIWVARTGGVFHVDLPRPSTTTASMLDKLNATPNGTVRRVGKHRLACR